MSLSRLAAATLLIASVILAFLFVLADATGPSTPGSTLAVTLGSLEAIAGVAALMAFPALLIGHPRRGRALTLAGYIGIFVIAAFTNVFISLTMALVVPWIAAQGVAVAQAPGAVGAIFFLLGPVQVVATALLAAGALRAGRRLAGWTFVVAAVVSLAGFAPVPEFVDTIAGVLIFVGIALVAAQGLGRDATRSVDATAQEGAASAAVAARQ